MRLGIMTRSDYHLVMKVVRVADLKARLSEHLRGVRRGRTLTVMDRDTPIARIIPYQGGPATLTVRPPLPDAPKLAALRMPPPLALKTDVVRLLTEERGDR
jgi:antitoxin (DNA-binding transcriptional repressor) of toxin-antitoxin stability system